MHDDTLPFEELDPCCQKEIEEERNKADVGRRLRKFDKLNQRNDTLKSVFGGLNEYKSCVCCSLQAVDYPLLAKLRLQLNTNSATSGIISDPISDEDDDDDEMWAGLEFDTLTPLEEERLLERKAREEMLRAASLNGFASHNEDSTNHINEMILQGRTVVCHFVNTNVQVCALIDFSLEGMAAKYLGTIFRRTKPSDETSAFRRKWNVGSSSANGGNREDLGPCLTVFVGGSLRATIFDLYQFGDGDESNSNQSILYEDELEKYLDQLGGLNMTLSTTLLRLNSMQFADSDEGSDDENFVSYCDTPGCGRFFPHEHIGGKNMSVGTGTLSGAAAADRGAEALAKDWCYKV